MCNYNYINVGPKMYYTTSLPASLTFKNDAFESPLFQMIIDRMRIMMLMLMLMLM